MKKSEIKKLVRETLREELSTPSDVTFAAKAQARAKNVGTANKKIDRQSEFPGSFEDWFTSLGFKPGKISKSFIVREVGAILSKLGYK